MRLPRRTIATAIGLLPSRVDLRKSDVIWGVSKRPGNRLSRWHHRSAGSRCWINRGDGYRPPYSRRNTSRAADARRGKSSEGLGQVDIHVLDMLRRCSAIETRSKFGHSQPGRTELSARSNEPTLRLGFPSSSLAQRSIDQRLWCTPRDLNPEPTD